MGTYINTATSMLSLMPTIPQTSSADGYSTTVVKIGRHITRAEAFVNGKIARRYDVSAFTNTSAVPLLKQASEDITTYMFMKAEFTSDNQNDNEWVESYRDALDSLDAIKKADCDLVDSSGDLIAERTTTDDDKVESNNEDYHPTMDEGDVLNELVDPDKLDDIGNAK